MAVRVMVVERYEFVRDALRIAILPMPGLELVAEASNASEAVGLAVGVLILNYLFFFEFRRDFKPQYSSFGLIAHNSPTSEVLTLDHFSELLEYPNLVRGVVNTLLIGVVGGALAVACYAAIALATHRWQSGWVRVMDYLAMVPRGMPGRVPRLVERAGTAVRRCRGLGRHRRPGARQAGREPNWAALHRRFRRGAALCDVAEVRPRARRLSRESRRWAAA